MRTFNVHTADIQRDDADPDGYRAGVANIGTEIGAATMAGKLFEVPPGQANCPFHWESDEEWLFVLSGRLTVRHPDGEDELVAGDVVCFPAGPAGAHKLTNAGEETVRMILVSTRNMPQVAVYPDSDKVGVFTDDPIGSIIFRREAGVDYYDGEA